MSNSNTKIFRFHRTGKHTETHWFTDAFAQKQIEEIPDPSGETHRKQVTSIPSPFARIDLVRTAFVNVVRLGDVRFKYLSEGGSPKLYHRLVSETLDIAQMVFNAGKMQGKLEIITWDKAKDLKSLTESTESKHRLLGETLQLFLDQDAQAYHFDQVERLHFFLYDHVILGGTSPVTLFFPSANPLPAHDRITFGEDVLFTENYRPLHVRDEDFIKYLYAMQKGFNGFTQLFKPFSDFLEATLEEVLKITRKPLYDEVMKINGAYYTEQYLELDTGTSNDHIILCGHTIRKRDVDHGTIGQKSGFVIQSEKYKEANKPLVLQNNFSGKIQYTDREWDPNQAVPYYDPLPLDKRILPGQMDQYPYLTVSDFLEPYLIQVPYPINKDRFFDGNQKGGENQKGYLLPLTQKFFDYFDTTDLIDGKVEMEMEERTGGSVRVKLKVPIRKIGLKIELSRIYNPSSNGSELVQIDRSRNEGYILNSEFIIAILPCVRVEDSADMPIDYRIATVDADNEHGTLSNKYLLEFYDDDNGVKILPQMTQRTKKDNSTSYSNSTYYALNKNFRYAQLHLYTGKGLNCKGVICPIWKLYAGKDMGSMDFAVDFGTTNTHIELRDGNRIEEFNFTQEDSPIGLFSDPNFFYDSLNRAVLQELYSSLNQLFVPAFIGRSFQYSYPARTALSLSKLADLQSSQMALGDASCAFVYEHETITNNQIILTDLKWNNLDTHARVHIRLYFEQVILMIRAKLLMNNKSLNKSKLIWFYPASMPESRLNDIDTEWRTLFNKYISKERDANPIMLSESVAPFYYFNINNDVVASHRPVVSIDIGGGTSDVIVFVENNPHILTSFRFAARSLFGDGFKPLGLPDKNGFVKKYKNRMRTLIQKNTGDTKTYQEIFNRGKAEDIISFWFALEQNKNIQNGSIMSFNRMLREDRDMKVIFVLFYTAIIYHVASMMKTKGLDHPIGFTFSGTASKLLDVVTNGSDLSLGSFTERIIEKVYDQALYGFEPLTLNREKEMAKEVTCKGGLVASDDQLNVNIRKIKYVHNPGITETLTYKRLLNKEDPILETLTNEVLRFMDFFLDMDRELSFEDTFGINPTYLDLMKKEMKLKVIDNLKEALKDKSAPYYMDKELEETVFFYPIISLIQRVSEKIGTATAYTE